MQGPGDPADNSVAEAGEVAEQPENGDIKIFEVTDEDDEPVGMLIKWDAAAWLWADAGDYEPLDP